MGIERLVSKAVTILERQHSVPFKAKNWLNAAEKLEVKGLTYAPKLKGDVATFTHKKFAKPTSEELKSMMNANGLKSDSLHCSDGKQFAYVDNGYICANNKIFLKELTELYPKKADAKVNFKVQKLMLYLQDVNHSTYPNKKNFLTKYIDEINSLEKLKANDGTLLYPDIEALLYTKKAILQAKYNNPERYEDLMNLIKLYKEGKIPRHNVQIFFPEGQLHALPKSDMQKLLKGESYFPEFKNLARPEEISKLDPGETFSVGEKMFVKTNNGYDELKIDKNLYQKLFPPVERYSISQNEVGNCGKIASWNAMIKNPNSRIELYKMFEPSANGVKVKIPNCGYEKEFNLNQLEMLYTPENLQGSIGHKMLEYTYDISRLKQMDIVGNARPNLITDILGIKPKQADWSFGMDMDKACIPHKNGIYVKNGGEYNLNIGDYDNHYYSTTNLTTGKWQNPWTGMEEIKTGKDLCISGSMHDFS